MITLSRAVLATTCAVSFVWHFDGVAQVDSRLAAPPPPHPRLFLADADVPDLAARIEGDARLQAVVGMIRAYSEKVLERPPLERRMTGHRLLDVSRTALQRVSYLALLYRLERDPRWLDRAEAEMLALAAFEDWNPGHYLDVAEMTAALAIGYDWLFDALSQESRAIIRDAIVEKGIQTSKRGGWWVRAEHNWNQVCHGGISLGAMAVMEDEPALASFVLRRAVEHVPLALESYEPAGIYPEGPSYWSYGTTYTVLLAAALESVYGDSFGITDHPGLMRSPYFVLHATAPTGAYYNFADSRPEARPEPAMFWLARRLGDASVLWQQQRTLDSFIKGTTPSGGTRDRMLAFLVLWAGAVDRVPEPDALHFGGDGLAPLGIHRSGWDRDATYVALKGGSPGTNHAHMDIGSFVLEMRGVRWGLDLGLQSYHGLESQGVELWNRSQDSERWTVFRLNNFSHNTLVVNDALQRVVGAAPLETYAPDYTIVNTFPAYRRELRAAKRGVRLFGDAVLIQDEVQARDAGATVRWAMATRAEVEIDPAARNRATLQDGDQAITMQILEPLDASLEVLDAETPPQPYDAPNPDTRLVAFTTRIPSEASATLVVWITPSDSSERAPEVVALDDW